MIPDKPRKAGQAGRAPRLLFSDMERGMTAKCSQMLKKSVEVFFGICFWG
jgi:hypothetical protein